jgi:hypothetical protein
MALTLLLAFLIAPLALSQDEYVKAIDWGKKTNNFQYGYGSFTWSNPLDTATFVSSYGTGFKWERTSQTDVVGTIVIESSSVNGDSISICGRYEVSRDGVNWLSYTIGTDSTTFATALYGTSYKLTVYPVLKTTLAGYMPYSRLRLYGKSTYNLAGTKVRVGFINQ